MRNIKKIFIVVFSLILLFAVSCSNDDKTGVKNNPPENDTEITDGETESSGSETGGSGTGGTGTGGSEEGGSGSGTGTGGDSGSETGGSGSGSGEGEGGTETPPTPSEPEIVTIDAKDFPTELLGRYKDDKLASSGFSGYNFETEVSTITDGGIQKTKIEGSWLKDGVTPPDTYRGSASIEKWKQTKKDGNPIKLEGEYYSEPNKEKYTIIYDYASGTLIGTCVHPDVTALFNGKK